MRPEHSSRCLPAAPLLIALLLLTSSARAQPQAAGSGEATARVSLYADNDDTTVVTTLADGSVALPADVKVGAHGLVDVVSTASVDVVSNASADVTTGATPRFEDVRGEVGGRASVLLTRQLDIGAGFSFSTERDWKSYAPSGRFGLDLFKRNLRIIGTYAYGHNRVRRAHDRYFRERQDSHSGELALTQLLDRKTLIGAAYTLQAVDGYQASPYRFVTIVDGPALRERHPESRLRQAVTFHGLRYLGGDMALQASYRIYGDDWGVQSNTLATSLLWELSELLDLRFRARGYHQRAADFWRERYRVASEHFSADRELSSFWNVGLGLAGALHFDDWTLDARLDGLYYRYLNFALLDNRLALHSGVGGRFEW